MNAPQSLKLTSMQDGQLNTGAWIPRLVRTFLRIWGVLCQTPDHFHTKREIHAHVGLAWQVPNLHIWVWQVVTWTWARFQRLYEQNGQKGYYPLSLICRYQHQFLRRIYVHVGHFSAEANKSRESRLWSLIAMTGRRQTFSVIGMRLPQTRKVTWPDPRKPGGGFEHLWWTTECSIYH